MGSSIGRRSDGQENQSWLHRYRIRWRGTDNSIGMLLAQVIVRRPSDTLCRLRREPEQLIFEAVRRLHLVRSIDDPVVHGKSVGQGKTGAKAHVVKGQEIKPIRP